MTPGSMMPGSMTPVSLRRPAVAGAFYPADPLELAAAVDGYLADATPGDDPRRPVALVVPHAGYVYSGPVAARAYAGLRPWRSVIRRVVVIGPAHRVAVRGLAVSSAEGFITPLGMVPVDTDATARVLAHRHVHVDDAAHGPEHSIEVQLPFLQRVLDDGWSLVPIVAGSASPTVVADAIADLWAAPDTLVIVSTDLSHYHDVDTARRLDRETAAAIVASAWERLDGARACGAVPLSGALELVRRRHERVRLLLLQTSADTVGPRDKVVGYGSFVVR